MLPLILICGTPTFETRQRLITIKINLTSYVSTVSISTVIEHINSNWMLTVSLSEYHLNFAESP